MSQEAYELLLKANELFSQNKKEEAIKAYREVLRLNPTPTQRQVAEDQLRSLGELPYSFKTSGKVIWRQERSRGDQRDGQRRQDGYNRDKRRTEGRKYSRDSRRERSTSREENGGDRRSGGTQFSVQTVKREEKSRQEGSTQYRRRSDKVFSVLESGRRKAESRARRRPQLSKSYKRQEQQKKQKWRSTQQRSTKKAKVKTASQQKSAKKSKFPPPPKQRFTESDRAYRKRLQRYEIWIKYLQRYPNVDQNTALRLEETGWTLKQLRAWQRERRREYLKRKKEFIREKLNENLMYEGPQLLEKWRESETPLFFWGNRFFIQRGTVAENELYYLNIRDKNGTVRRYNKLRLEGIIEEQYLKKFSKHIKIDPQVANRSLKVPLDPKKRPNLDQTLLDESIKNKSELFLPLFSGIVLQGKILWHDPYHLYIQLNIPKTKTRPIRALVFKHGIREILTQAPENFEELPSYLEFYNQRKEMFPKNGPTLE